MAKKKRKPKTPDPASFAFGVLQHVIEATGDKLLLAHVPVQYRRHDGHEHEDEDGGEWTGLGEGCHRDNRRESEMACGARQGKAGAVAGFRAAEQMPDGQAPESEDRNGA